MEREYWIGRKRASIAMAQSAAGSEARLIHYQLAELYGIRAAQCPLALMLPDQGPATIGECDALLPPYALRPRRRLCARYTPHGGIA